MATKRKATTMTDAERTHFYLRALDGDDAARCFIAGYETAEADVRRIGELYVVDQAKFGQRGNNESWASGYRRKASELGASNERRQR